MSPFTIVTVVHDSARELAGMLDSVQRHLGQDAELIVVDSGSSDDGASLARGSGATVIELPDNPGFGAANNAGVARASNDVTVLLNPDVELLDGGLRELAERADDDHALLAPRLVGRDGRVQDSAHPPPGTLEALIPALLPVSLLPAPLRLRSQPWRADAGRDVGWAIAACLAARTADLLRLGPFDPGSFLFYEDMDLCLRARAIGIPTRLCPDIAVAHAGRHSTDPVFGGEPFELLARRRRAVVGARLSRAALALDDLSQGLTFATRAAGRIALGRSAEVQLARLAALRLARRGSRGAERRGSPG